MSTLPVRSEPEDAEPAAELGSLARELARGYAELVESHRRSWGITAAEADAKARENGEQWVEVVRDDPPDQINWWAISKAIEHDPEAGLATWERIKDAARQELRSGHRTAQALEWGNKPFDRARFLALRDSFRREWRPRGGVEAALVDLLAEGFASYLQWRERLSLYAETECRSEDSKAKREGYWVPPRVKDVAWMDWCAKQAEAAHRRFLATLRTMQELRRLPAVTIASASQVNVGQQQVNIAAPSDDGTA